MLKRITTLGRVVNISNIGGRGGHLHRFHLLGCRPPAYPFINYRSYVSFLQKDDQNDTAADNNKVTHYRYTM